MKLLELITNQEGDIELVVTTLDAANAQMYIQGGAVPEVIKFTIGQVPHKVSHVLVHDSSNINEYKLSLITKTVNKLDAMITGLSNTKQKLIDAEFQNI